MAPDNFRGLIFCYKDIQTHHYIGNVQHTLADLSRRLTKEDHVVIGGEQQSL
jgi:hypothetical protein